MQAFLHRYSKFQICTYSGWNSLSPLSLSLLSSAKVRSSLSSLRSSSRSLRIQEKYNNVHVVNYMPLNALLYLFNSKVETYGHRRENPRHTIDIVYIKV